MEDVLKRNEETYQNIPDTGFSNTSQASTKQEVIKQSFPESTQKPNIEPTQPIKTEKIVPATKHEEETHLAKLASKATTQIEVKPVNKNENIPIQKVSQPTSVTESKPKETHVEIKIPESKKILSK